MKINKTNIGKNRSETEDFEIKGVAEKKKKKSRRRGEEEEIHDKDRVKSEKEE